MIPAAMEGSVSRNASTPALGGFKATLSRYLMLDLVAKASNTFSVEDKRIRNSALAAEQVQGYLGYVKPYLKNKQTNKQIRHPCYYIRDPGFKKILQAS